jgi:SIR2-like domain
MPTAANITVSETLELLDGPFRPLAEGVAQGRYVPWLGSAISRDRVDDLPRALTRMLEHLRTIADPDGRFRRALLAVLGAVATQPEVDGIDLATAAGGWPLLPTLLPRLAKQYSQILDIEVEGEESDYLLWDAIDVRATYANAHSEPDAEHFAIALLVLEGVFPDIVSANWDGLIERAVSRCVTAPASPVRVCVRPEDFRELRLRSDLLKFHGCAVLAASSPANYRSCLIGRHQQIISWHAQPEFAVMRAHLIDMATTRPTLMIGLSAQDVDIQQVFVDSAARMPWTWPSIPPAYVFAEETLGPYQDTILKCVYRGAYAANVAPIKESSRIGAFAKPLLCALVLWVLTEKLRTLARLAPHVMGVADLDRLVGGLQALRNLAAASGEPDRLIFIGGVISAFSMCMSIFRTGEPAIATKYYPIGQVPVHMIAGDAGTGASGMTELAAAVALCGIGMTAGAWHCAAGSGRGEAIVVTPPAGPAARLYFVASANALLQLQVAGLVSTTDRDVVVVHSKGPIPARARSPRAVLGRTGASGPREVDFGTVLQEAVNCDELLRRFREEAAL